MHQSISKLHHDVKTGKRSSSADFFRRTLDQRLAEHHRRADRRLYFGAVLSMAARSASEHDWAFPRRFYRRAGSAILLLKKIRIRGLHAVEAAALRSLPIPHPRFTRRAVV